MTPLSHSRSFSGYAWGEGDEGFSFPDKLWDAESVAAGLGILGSISDLYREYHDGEERVIGFAHFLSFPHEVYGGDASIHIV